MRSLYGIPIIIPLIDIAPFVDEMSITVVKVFPDTVRITLISVLLVLKEYESFIKIGGTTYANEFDVLIENGVFPLSKKPKHIEGGNGNVWVLSTCGVDSFASAVRYIHATLSDVARFSAHTLKSPKAPIASKKKNRLAQGDDALAYVQLSINYKNFLLLNSRILCDTLFKIEPGYLILPSAIRCTDDIDCVR